MATKIVDFAQAAEMVDGDKDFYLELTEIFFGEYDNLRQSIEVAIQQKNAKELNQSAHTAKGALGNLCAISARDLASKLELMGVKANFDDAESIFASFCAAVDEYRKLVAEIRISDLWERSLGTST